MGFLDHSTNNIIVDAVLTDLGRQAMANGTFNVASFSLADDEVDYTLIEKFGRTVGKEKIIKNTPIFEAQTVATLAMKHRLLTIADATFIYVPTMSVERAPTSFTPGSNQEITLTQTITGVTNLSAFPIDTEFFVELPNRFLKLLDSGRGTSSIIEQGTQTAIYTVAGTSTSPGTLPSVTLKVATQGIDATVFNTFGTNSAKTRIDCVISVIGTATGLRTTIPVVIQSTAT